MRTLAETCGYATSMNHKEMPSTTVIEGRTVNQHDMYTLTVHTNERYNIRENSHNWYKCRSAKPTYKSKIVYNLTVEEDNSYVADSIVVHNCQNLTYAGNREGLNGKHSSLFYKLVECLEKYNPKYFIVENVKMDKRWENEFTRLLGVQPIHINSNLFSAQNRDRLYWTNINVTHLPVKNSLVLGDIVREEDYNDIRLYQSKQHIEAFRRMDSKWSACLLNQKCKPIMASYYKRAYIHHYLECRNAESGFRMLSPEECEILQTLPVRYTGCISQSRRYQTIGNGWTVDVVAHILKFINENPVIELGWVKTNGKQKSLF
jgi:site-specific DNA-cytosine methylase